MLMKTVQIHLMIFLLSASLSCAKLQSSGTMTRPIMHDYDKIISETRYEEWVSPDGHQVCYAVPAGGMKVILVDVATGKKTILLESPRWIDLDWSPDSRYLTALNHWDGHGTQVVVYHMEHTKDGIKPGIVFKTEDEDSGVHWGMVAWNLSSKTAILSQRIEFEKGGQSYYSLNLKNAKLTPVKPDDPVYSNDPQIMRKAHHWNWLSPNGRYICCNGENDSIYLGDRDSHTTCSLMNSMIGNFAVSWSPDAKFIAISDMQKNLNTSTLTVFHITPMKGKFKVRVAYRAPLVTGTEWKVAKWDGDQGAVVQAKVAKDPHGPSGYSNQYSLTYTQVQFNHHTSDWTREG